MSYIKIDNTFPSVHGKTINGMTVSDVDHRGGTFVDQLNLSTRFMRCDYNDLEGMLKSPHNWRGSLRHEGAFSIGDHLHQQTDSGYLYHPPSSEHMTFGKNHTIDFQLPVYVLGKTLVDTMMADLPDHSNAVYNFGDWDASGVSDPLPFAKTNVVYGIRGVSDPKTVEAGRHYISIDVSNATLPTGASLTKHVFYRPFMVLDDPSEWKLNLAGFTFVEHDSSGYLWKFVPGSVLHEYMEYVPSMFSFDLVRSTKPTKQEPYTRITLPAAGVKVTGITSEAISIHHFNFDTYTSIVSDQTNQCLHTIRYDGSNVTMLTQAIEPIIDIRVEFVTPPNYNYNLSKGAWGDGYKREHMRVYGRTKNGYHFLINPSKYSVSLPYAKNVPYDDKYQNIVKVSLLAPDGTTELITRELSVSPRLAARV
jgi:hypothetical protein